MRYDDTLNTVLSADRDNPVAARSAWRQLVDLVGRGRVPADAPVMAALDELRRVVPLPVRSASARALFGAAAPAPLVRLLALDDIAVAAPILRTARLEPDEWIALLPALTPTARAVLRHRRDLPAEVDRALASFGPVDFVIPATGDAGDMLPQPAEPEPPAPIDAIALPAEVAPPESAPFVSVGSIARSIPVVAEALRRENSPEPPLEGGTFRISDVVARIEAYRRRQEEGADEAGPATPPPPEPPLEGFRFETDVRGAIRWVDGIARGAVIGMSLAQTAQGVQGVDAATAGAFRQRARMSGARLTIGGAGPDAGLWLVSAVPAFDPASGRFTGYRGTGRRPREREVAGPRAPTGDSLRQLVHELRTPVNAIAGFSEMIEHEMLGPVADPYRRDARAMRRDAGHLLAAIDDIDIAARIEGGALEQRPEAVELAAFLAERARSSGEEGVPFAVEGTPPAVWGDRRAVERVVARLIGVAAGTAGPGEPLVIDAGRAGDGFAAIAVTRPLALRDTDPGALFELGGEDSPTSLLGTGFALRLVRGLAGELGGRLVIDRERLTLYLPLALDGPMGQARPN